MGRARPLQPRLRGLGLRSARRRPRQHRSLSGRRLCGRHRRAKGFAASSGAARLNSARRTVDEARSSLNHGTALVQRSGRRHRPLGLPLLAGSMTSSGAPDPEGGGNPRLGLRRICARHLPGGVPDQSISPAEELMHGTPRNMPDQPPGCSELGSRPSTVMNIERLRPRSETMRRHIDRGAFRSIVYRDEVIRRMTWPAPARSIDRRHPKHRSGTGFGEPMDGLTASARSPVRRWLRTPRRKSSWSDDAPGDSTPIPSHDALDLADPSAIEQFEADVAFVDDALVGEPIGRSISYVVLGTETGNDRHWPPSGAVNHRLSLAANRLTTEPSRRRLTLPVDPKLDVRSFDPRRRSAARRSSTETAARRPATPDLRRAPMPEKPGPLRSQKPCLVLSSNRTGWTW